MRSHGVMLRVRQARAGEEKLLSNDEIDDLMAAFSAEGPPPNAPTVAPASGCVRAAAEDDGIEELVDGVVEGWGDEVA